MTDVNVKPFTSGQRLGRQAMSLLAADIAGGVMGVGVLSQVNKIDQTAPGVTGAMRSFLKGVIKPILHPIETLLGYAKGIEGEEDFKKRMALPEEQRAQIIADAGFRYITAGAAGYGTMYFVNQALNKKLGVPLSRGHGLALLGVDAAVHLGSIVTLGSPMMAPVSQQLKTIFTKIFKGCGVGDERAKDMAQYTIAVEIPNYITYGLDVAFLHALNKKTAAQHIAAHL